MVFFHLHQMWDVLLATFPDTSASPVRCCGKPHGSSRALRHWVWPVHLCHSCRSVWWVESRLAEHWTMLPFVVSRHQDSSFLKMEKFHFLIELFTWLQGAFLEESITQPGDDGHVTSFGSLVQSDAASQGWSWQTFLTLIKELLCL